MNPGEKKLLRLLLIAFAGMTIAIGILAEFIVQTFPLSPYRIGLRIVCILLDLLLLFRILHLLLLRAEMKPRRQKGAMVVGGFLFIVLLLEIPFMYVPYSHGNGNTYGSRIWFNRYWQTNRLGYRDREPHVDSTTKTTKMMFLGDSFVAGHGIKDPEDRFSDIVGRKLGSQFAVYNLGRNAADTKEEYENLRKYPIKPDIVVLSHIPNDIEKVKRPGHQQGFGPIQNPKGNDLVQLSPQLAGTGFLRFLSQGSFTLNYIYWKFNGFIEGVEPVDLQQKPEDFGDNHVSCYFDPTALAEHHHDLHQIVDWCQSRDIRLLILTFPETYDGAIDFTQTAVNLPLESRFQPEGIPFVHAYKVLKPIPMADRVVNYNDLHPSTTAHQAVARMLMDKFRELGWVGE